MTHMQAYQRSLCGLYLHIVTLPAIHNCHNHQADTCVRVCMRGTYTLLPWAQPSERLASPS